MSLSNLLASLESLSKDAKEQVSQGKQVSLKKLLKPVLTSMSGLSVDEKKIAGQTLNRTRLELEALINNHTNNSTFDWIDVSAPTNVNLGSLHPVTQAIEEITQIFSSLGFTRMRYPEVDWDYYVFEALNMPASHPARDEWETFFVDQKPDPIKGAMVLTTHTSNGQVREMERVGTPPIRMINIAKCYRRQQDITHTPMFHQFEGLMIDKGVTIAHLKGTIEYFAKRFYGPTAKSRIRPFHFQFTEPSFEVDFSCTLCDGTGCRFCKSGWHEVGGAGMVHPNVLRAGGIDPDAYTGFAFGWGIERTYTLKPGLKLDDIRRLYENAYSVLSQFSL